jgi:hypothetical protein
VATTNPVVYYARAVDGLDRAAVLRAGRELAATLVPYGLALIDPVAAWGGTVVDEHSPAAQVDALVNADLALLRGSDAVLMDMSRPGRDYVGCVCELTYAHLWHIPAVVWVGDTGLQHRAWLRYHATVVVREAAAAVSALIPLARARPSRGPRRDSSPPG